MKMKSILLNVYYKLSVLGLALSLILPMKASAAGSARLYFNGSNSATVGSTYRLGISVDPAGSTITALYLEITYDTSKLSPITNALTITSGFPDLPVENSVGGGRILLEGAGVNKNISTNTEIAAITFTATSAGSATFNYEATTQVLDNDSNDVTGVKESKTVTINTATSTGGGTSGGSTGGRPRSGGSGSTTGGGSTTGSTDSTTSTSNQSNTNTQTTVESKPSNNSNNTTTNQSPPANNTPEKDTTLPLIENIKLESLESNIKYNLSWTTNEEAISIVEYGAFKDALFTSTGSGDLTTNHKAILDLTAFKENEEFFYRITATDKSGNKSLSEILSNKSISSNQQNPQTEPSKEEESSRSNLLLIIGSVGLFLVLILGLVIVLIRKKRLHLSNNDQSLSPANLHTSLFDDVPLSTNINPKENKVETPNVPFTSNIKKDEVAISNNSDQQNSQTPLAVPPEDIPHPAPENNVASNDTVNSANKQPTSSGNVPLPGQVIAPNNPEDKNS